MSIDTLKLCDIYGEYKDVAECIGIDAFKKLISLCSGQTIYIPKADTFEKFARDKDIIRMFDGTNYKEIAKKYNLTERRIRDDRLSSQVQHFVESGFKRSFPAQAFAWS